jgi:hypothetical protein
VTEEPSEQPIPPRRFVKVFGRKMPMPQSRALRISLGVALVLLGTLGFLPVLGFWMIPLGLLVLSHDHSGIRRVRRRTAVRWEKRRRKS